MFTKKTNPHSNLIHIASVIEWALVKKAFALAPRKAP